MYVRASTFIPRIFSFTLFTPVYVYVCTRIFINIYLYMKIYTYVRIFECIYVYMYVHYM